MIRFLYRLRVAIFGEPWPVFWARSSARLAEAARKARESMEQP